ncbi:MAG: ScyD/ScyE family protein [Saprospiraceae bacterium]|nr:ScyD/ScyE family protein [Saprospiraceae bacterium]
MKKQLLLLATAIFMATFTLNAQVTPTVVGAGFVNGLIGIEVDSVGNLWVAETGNGNDDGRITIIAPNGSQTTFMTGLPSSLNPFTGEIAGPSRTVQLPNNKVMVIVGEGTHTQAEALLIVDKTNFNPSTPLTLANVEGTIKIGDFVHAQGFAQSNPYNLTWDANGNLLIADAGGNSIVKQDQVTGNLSIVATLAPFPNPCLLARRSLTPCRRTSCQSDGAASTSPNSRASLSSKALQTSSTSTIPAT